MIRTLVNIALNRDLEGDPDLYPLRTARPPHTSARLAAHHLRRHMGSANRPVCAW